MKISVDGGALCAGEKSRFGNYTVSVNLFKALSRFDHKNKYEIYTFCDELATVRSSATLKYSNLKIKKFWLKGVISIRELFSFKEVFLAVNQAIPLIVKGKVISFSHGLAFHYYPNLYPDSYRKMRRQLKEILKKSMAIIVPSEKVRDELKAIDRSTNSRIVVLPYAIPFDMVPANNKKVKKKYFLFSGMNHPIKNIEFIINSFELFLKDKKFSEYRLFLVGNFPAKFSSNHIRVFSNISRKDLKRLYQEATAYLTGSLYESFNLPVLESLSQNTQVIGLSSAIIPELEEYVNVVKDKESFVKSMKRVAGGQIKRINQKKLLNMFSWRNYIEKLTALYR